MAFYPIITIPNFLGKTTLFNFAPNNWESPKKNTAKFVNASWAQEGYWHTKSIFIIEPDAYVEVTSDQSAILSKDSHFFLSMSFKYISDVSLMLPKVFESRTSYPQWRANMQISSRISSTSYLGEISPFPLRSSCLSYGGMIQQTSLAKNFIIFINLEHSPVERIEVLEIHNSITGKLIETFEVKNNSINLIEMDLQQFKDDFLPVITCRGMGGIPLYFSYDKNLASLSLEHTHPPSSYVVHGDRNAVQRELKNYWFRRCEQ